MTDEDGKDGTVVLRKMDNLYVIGKLFELRFKLKLLHQCILFKAQFSKFC